MNSDGVDANRPLRKDAERNRHRLLDAGRELFAEHGLDVTLNDIAHHAGVGVGTAYRRFANKGELIEALLAEQVEEISTLADAALDDPDPWHGLVWYLEQVIALRARDRVVAHIVSGHRRSPAQYDWSRDILAPKVIAITERAKQAGSLRGDVEGTDLVFVQVAVLAVVERARDGAPDLYRRYLHLILDGLRAHPNEPGDLPVPALTLEQTHAMMGPGQEPSATNGVTSTG